MIAGLVAKRLPPEQMFPAGDSRFRTREVVLSNEIRLRVVECGDPASDRIVVCVHGWACSVYSFHALLPLLADRGVRAIAIEMVGHGLSSKPAGAEHYTLDAMTGYLEAALDQLAIARATVVGHSMGGAIAARLAVLHPARVERLVLAAPVGFGDALPLRLALLVTPQLLDRALPYLVPRWTVPLVLRLAYGTRRPPLPRDCDEYWAPTQFPAFTRAMRTTLHVFDWRVGERPGHGGFSTIPVPATLIYGEQDHFVVRQAARRYADVIRGIRLIPLSDCGHVIPEEAPEVVAEAVLADW